MSQGRQPHAEGDRALTGLLDPQHLWDRRFENLRSSGRHLHLYEPWLAKYESHIASHRDALALDLGCGQGQDARYLSQEGLGVVAADFSREALGIAREAAPNAALVQLDVRDGLPFPGGTFDLIVARLSLHYHLPKRTRQILSDVRDCLLPSGLLLARFNAVGDVNHGSAGHREVAPGCFVVNGELKRFFGCQDLQKLFCSDWRILSLARKEFTGYGTAKVLWELVAQRVEVGSH